MIFLINQLIFYPLVKHESAKHCWLNIPFEWFNPCFLLNWWESWCPVVQWTPYFYENGIRKVLIHPQHVFNTRFWLVENDGVRQLELLFPTEWKVIKFHGSKPPTSRLYGCWTPLTAPVASQALGFQDDECNATFDGKSDTHGFTIKKWRKP